MTTPSPSADASINGTSTKVVSAPKDKSCPFCQQGFTSSSLGRHLDLYIKEKNAKPADGVHDVDQIRKLRGGITRRQPRSSTGKRDDSTIAGSPAAPGATSPGPETARETGSPSVSREDAMDIGTSNLPYTDPPRVWINKATWENTGVMNDIPRARNRESETWEADKERQNQRERAGSNRGDKTRSFNKQTVAKSSFEQKQKTMDALDSAKAAELALRELLGSIRAAMLRIEQLEIFDYDPLALDFSGLCLRCLPPPPTLHTSTPISTSKSWSISPPSDVQYEALRLHFSSNFRSYYKAISWPQTYSLEDLSYPPPSDPFITTHEDPATVSANLTAKANELEAQITSHLHDVYAAWNTLPAPKRSEIWTLELARSVGRQNEEIKNLKKERHLAHQKCDHLEIKLDELNRIQQPKEFRLVAPKTIPVSTELVSEISFWGQDNLKTVGYTLSDRREDLKTVVDRTIGRWKTVVKEARNGGGIAGQRTFSGEYLTPKTDAEQDQTQSPIASGARGENRQNEVNQITEKKARENDGGIGEADADGDGDADMEGSSSYHGGVDAEHQTSRNAFRMNNNTGDKHGAESRMEGIDRQSVQGYVRIGA